MPITIHLPQENGSRTPSGVIYDASNGETHKVPTIEFVPAGGKKINIRSLKVHSKAIADHDLKAINGWLSKRLPVKITKPVRFRYPETIKAEELGTPVEFTISGRYANTGLFSFGSSDLTSTTLLQFDATTAEPETDASTNNEGGANGIGAAQPDSPTTAKNIVSIVVEPHELIVTPNKEAELRITVRGLPSCERPSVTLETENDQEDPFAAAVERVNVFFQLHRPKTRDGLNADSRTQPKDGDEIVWYQDILIDLTEPEERSLHEFGSVRRKLKIEVADLAPIRHSVLIAKAANGVSVDYPGWISIDFGTSYSTVTVFDPHHVKPLIGLPKEQFDRLCRKFLKTLDGTRNPQNESGLPAELCEAWNETLNAIGDQISDHGGRRVVEDAFRKGNAETCYVILGRLETRLADTHLEELRTWGLKWLHQLFDDVFRVPPLEALNLRPVEFDVGDNTLALEISSELEVSHLHPLRVELGADAHQISSGIDKDGPVRSFRTLKRYIGQEHSFLVEANGQVDRVSAEELIQSAWRRLRDLTDEHRQRLPEEFSKGDFSRAILTYPTVSPPSVRRQYEKYGRDLFRTMVWTDYDEAVSSAIFYLMRDYDLGGSLQVGLDTFRSRSHPSPVENPTSWSHNILVFDIGGGTTDLALIELTLEVEDPLAKEDEDSRGGHGRYYRMTPKLLGSTGHLQLGGQLITLRVFQAMKAILADELLSHMEDFPVDTRNVWLQEIRKNPEGEEIIMEGDAYIEGSLADLSHLTGRHGQYLLDVANAIIPTRWKYPDESATTDSAGRRRAFGLLWKHAEAAKIYLGSSGVKTGETALDFRLSEEECREVLTACDDLPVGLGEDLNLAFSREQFEIVVQPVIHEAAMLAKGLVATRLHGRSAAGGEPQLDWLILSGKSCNLDLVMRELRSELSTLPSFTWNRERITFDPEFAKLSTSIGACYAERLRQFAFDKDAAVKFMKKGLDQLEFDIKNLFFFLPCSFTRMVPFGEEPVTEIFQVGTELYQLDGEPVGKARTAWDRMTLQVTVLRKDYEGGTPHQWGTFIAEQLREELQITREELRRNVWVQFEVDHRQQFQLYLCRKNGSNEPALEDLAKGSDADGFPAFHRGPAHFLVYGTGGNSIDASSAIDPSRTPLVSKDENGTWVLNYRIAVGVVTLVANTGHEETVFNAGNCLTESFRSDNSDGVPRAGLIATSPLDTFYQNGSMLIHALDENTEDGWFLLGQLERPRASEFPQKCYLTLDEAGAIQLHQGTVPYKKAPTPKEMWENPGFVYQVSLESAPSEADPQRDPFSGIH